MSNSSSNHNSTKIPCPRASSASNIHNQTVSGSPVSEIVSEKPPATDDEIDFALLYDALIEAFLEQECGDA
jgi:hypothetical protein